MEQTGTKISEAEVLAALDAALQLALDAGYDPDQIIDTVAASLYPPQH